MYLLYENNVRDKVLGEKNTETKYDRRQRTGEQGDNPNTKFQK